MFVNCQDRGQGFSMDIDMFIENLDNFSDRNIILFSNLGICYANIFKCLKNIKFCFIGQIFTDFRKRIRFTVGKLTGNTFISSLVVVDKALAVRKSRMNKLFERIAMHYGRTGANRTREAFVLQF